MRGILCERCGQERNLRDGERRVPSSDKWEPAEYQRVVWGTARTPTTEQRTIWVNDEPHPMATSGYNCDSCNASINPGERCCAWSAWLEGGPTVDAWENEYLTAEPQG